MKIICILIVLSILLLKGFCIENVKSNLQSKIAVKSGEHVFRSLVLIDRQEKQRSQRNQRPGNNGVGINLVPGKKQFFLYDFWVSKRLNFALVDIICFYARFGRWPTYPFYLQQSVFWMSRLIFSMDDNGIRSFCRQFNYFTGSDSSNYDYYWVFKMQFSKLSNKLNLKLTFVFSKPFKGQNGPNRGGGPRQLTTRRFPTRRTSRRTTTQFPTYDYYSTDLTDYPNYSNGPTAGPSGEINFQKLHQKLLISLFCLGTGNSGRGSASAG